MTSAPSLTVFRQRSVAATLTLMVFELVFSQMAVLVAFVISRPLYKNLLLMMMMMMMVK